MKLRELFQELELTRKEIGSSPIFLCGGTPRDKYMNKLDNISDLDMTTGDKTVEYLSEMFYDKLHKKYNITKKNMSDGHSSIFIGKVKVDFSSNFNVPNIDQILNKIGIVNPTNMQREMYSRDFTCNALLMTLDLKTITDPTKHGFKDIKDKKIKTCLSPEITLTTNRNRVVRAIYMACKLGFDIDDNIINYVTNNPTTINLSTKKSISDKLSSAFVIDGDKASYLLTKMNLWNHIPIVEPAYQYYQKYLKGKSNVKK